MHLRQHSVVSQRTLQIALRKHASPCLNFTSLMPMSRACLDKVNAFFHCKIAWTSGFSAHRVAAQQPPQLQGVRYCSWVVDVPRGSDSCGGLWSQQNNTDAPLRSFYYYILSLRASCSTSLFDASVCPEPVLANRRFSHSL
jgi:hypothetical protein